MSDRRMAGLWGTTNNKWLLAERWESIMKVKPIVAHEQSAVTMEGASGAKMRMLVGPDEGARNFHMRHFEVEPGGKYDYLLELRGEETFVFTLGSITLSRGRFTLYQNYPNPFNPTTAIRFDLPDRARVSLQIFDVTGRSIRTIIDGRTLAPSSYTFQWDGMNRAGQPVRSGVYFYRLAAGSRFQIRKMVLLK